MKELIDYLKIAVSNAEAHSAAQKRYCAYTKVPAPFSHCNTSFCLAGNKVFTDYLEKFGLDAAEESLVLAQTRLDSMGAMSSKLSEGKQTNAWSYAANTWRLNDSLATLAFSMNTNYLLHSFLIILLENKQIIKEPIGLWGGEYTDFSKFHAEVGDTEYYCPHQFISELSKLKC